jgi:ribosomal protein S18 acetylase RimI-like enzyme
MSASPARIRPATAADRDAVLAFCQETFTWGDYIADVWDHWLSDPDGILLVADVAGQPVAVGHGRLLSATEAWLEGLRVQADHRRHGIADGMNAAGCDWAKARGATVARLATDSTNTPAIAQVTRLGFAPVAEFGHWTAGAPAVGTDTGVRSAGAGDGPTIAAAWRASELHPAGGGLVAVGWAWRRMTAVDLDSAVPAGRLLLAGQGCGLLDAEAGETRMTWLGGPPAEWPRLLGGARRLAALGGLAEAAALLPRHAGLDAALAEAGFEHEGTYRIFAKSL